MEEILTLREVADYLKLSQVTILRLAQEGLIPGSKIGRQWRFSKEKVRALIHDQEIIRRMDLRK
ncbi:MAG: DNA-binding protein [Omnitrophica bacterium GWA2_50_21]|nr:MAG: DNA-binding protein [Omnitrophica bacterium GWA2_50_21]